MTEETQEQNIGEAFASLFDTAGFAPDSFDNPPQGGGNDAGESAGDGTPCSCP
jgi:hypothetical protein